MTAKEARIKTQHSDAHLQECISSGIARINEACAQGKYNTWLELPVGDTLLEPFKDHFRVLGYLVQNISGNQVYISW